MNKTQRTACASFTVLFRERGSGLGIEGLGVNSLAVMDPAIDPGYQVFGRQATYADRDDLYTACTVVLSFDLSRWGDSINVTGEQCMINVRRAEVPHRPRRGETFTLKSGQVYRVDQVMQATEYEYMILSTET